MITVSSAVPVLDVIQVNSEQMLVTADSEQMLVTNVTKGAVTVYNLTVTRAFNGTTLASHSVNTPVLKASLDTVIQVTNAGGKSSVTAGNTIQIDTEQMLVDSVISVAPQVWNLVVERAQNGTTKVGHNQGKPVVQVVDDSVIQVIDANGATGQEINAGMVIQIESEQMLVDSVVPQGTNTGIFDLIVERGFNFTTEVAHTSGKEVKWFPDQTIQVDNGTPPVSVGDTIQIDTGANLEQMLVVAVSFDNGKGAWYLTVQRHYGQPASAEKTHASGLEVFQIAFTGAAAAPAPCMQSTGTVALVPGTYYGGICIGAAAGAPNCTGANCKAVGGSTSTLQPYPAPGVTVAASGTPPTGQTGDDTDPNYNKLVVSDASNINVGDLIAIDDEDEIVTAKSGNTLTVTREANGSLDAAHAVGAQVFKVVTTFNGTEYSDKETLDAKITSTTPGNLQFVADAATTTAGGGVIQMNDVIQIDNEAMTVTNVSQQGPNPSKQEKITVTRPSDSTTATTHAAGAHILLITAAGAPAPPTVTLTKGVYIMAGGGFSVCGAGSVSAAKGVLIYNTNDPTQPTGNGALGQVNINTSGNVHLGPMTDGIYAGLTIFQDRALTLVPGTACNGKTGNPSQWDIALQSAAPLPTSGELGSISGTIYAPHLRADFGDSMSGTANLAVVTSCIYINGANSTFNFNPTNGQLFGVTETLGG